MSKKDYTHIKANGLRNELKDIRKSLDKLTNVLEIMLEIQYSAAIKHTHRYEKDYINNLPDDRSDDSRLFEDGKSYQH